jgi:hypothetical protein
MRVSASTAVVGSVALVLLAAWATAAPAAGPTRVGCADGATMAGQPVARMPAGAACQGHHGAACGPAACGRPCGHGHCCQRQCCPGGHCGHCCLGACCHGLCDGHWLHHDVYEKRYFLRSQGKSWHSAWYDPAEGRPIALVVPPTAEFQTQYGWGVPSSRVAPLYHQFRRPYPGPGAVAGGSGGFLPTPRLPSDTVQFGVNAVRGPWGAY